ncbi:MAG: aminoacyl--tRNA ligase-related protein [Oligoflexales bacterium]
MLSLEKIKDICLKRGFFYKQNCGSLEGIYELGPLGVILKNNIISSWKHSLLSRDYEIYSMETSNLTPLKVWEVSQHTKNFHDPVTTCTRCSLSFRTDKCEHDLKDSKVIYYCPKCGNESHSIVSKSSLLFETNVNLNAKKESKFILRPEGSQLVYLQYKNLIDSMNAKIPFGVSHIGRSFRNETFDANSFIFRSLEFDQLDVQFFVSESEAIKYLDIWTNRRLEWYKKLSNNPANYIAKTIPQDDRSHYSSQTNDILFNFPWGKDEIEGVACRNDLLGLKNFFPHAFEGVRQEDLPFVIEPSAGLQRMILSFLFDAAVESESTNQVNLNIHHDLVPYHVSININGSMPLVNLWEDLHQKNKNIRINKTCESENKIFELINNQIGTLWTISKDMSGYGYILKHRDKDLHHFDTLESLSNRLALDFEKLQDI